MHAVLAAIWQSGTVPLDLLKTSVWSSHSGRRKGIDGTAAITAQYTWRGFCSHLSEMYQTPHAKAIWIHSLVSPQKTVSGCFESLWSVVVCRLHRPQEGVRYGALEILRLREIPTRIIRLILVLKVL